MAEREGFEPSVEYNPYNRLAGGCLQPLGHLSAHHTFHLAEGEGLEPPRACARRISNPLPYQLGLALQRKNHPLTFQEDHRLSIKTAHVTVN